MNKKVQLNLAGLMLVTLALTTCDLGNSSPLSKTGLYDFGTQQNLKFTDTSRADRKARLTVWYPAVLPEDTQVNLSL